MFQSVRLYIPAMATLRQPAAHRGASAAALRAMCMCVLVSIAGRCRVVCSSFTPFGVLVLVFIFKCRCVDVSFRPLEVCHRRRKHKA